MLHAIADLTAANGTSPTYQEIADELDYPNKSRVWEICQDLHGRGWLETGSPNGAWKLVLKQAPPPLPEYQIETTEAAFRYLEERKSL